MVYPMIYRVSTILLVVQDFATISSITGEGHPLSQVRQDHCQDHGESFLHEGKETTPCRSKSHESWLILVETLGLFMVSPLKMVI